MKRAIIITALMLFPLAAFAQSLSLEYNNAGDRKLLSGFHINNQHDIVTKFSHDYYDTIEASSGPSQYDYRNLQGNQLLIDRSNWYVFNPNETNVYKNIILRQSFFTCFYY